MQNDFVQRRETNFRKDLIGRSISVSAEIAAVVKNAEVEIARVEKRGGKWKGGKWRSGKRTRTTIHHCYTITVN